MNVIDALTFVHASSDIGTERGGTCEQVIPSIGFCTLFASIQLFALGNHSLPAYPEFMLQGVAVVAKTDNLKMKTALSRAAFSIQEARESLTRVN